MGKINVEIHLEQDDLNRLEQWVAHGKFESFADAVQCAVHTALHQWRHDEFADPAPGGYDGKGSLKATANALPPTTPAGGGLRHIVIGERSDYDPQLEGLSPADFVAPADEWLAVYPRPAAGNP